MEIVRNGVIVAQVSLQQGVHDWLAKRAIDSRMSRASVIRKMIAECKQK